MTLANLQLFCGTRPALKNPFSVKNHTYASDGRILIRVPLIPGTPETEIHPQNPSQVIPENLENYIPATLPPGWQDIPQKTTSCTRCSASGKLTYTVSVCTHCAGSGTEECFHCHHEGDCQSCLGKGELHTHTPGGSTCPDCEGHGHQTHATCVSLNHGLCFVGLHYLKLAHTLPNLRIRLLDGLSCLRLDFDGGIGALMPIRIAPSDAQVSTNSQWPVETKQSIP